MNRAPDAEIVVTTDVYARVGAAIRARRNETGMTQAALAVGTGLGRTSITNIENGTQAILLHQLIEIARALRIDAGELLSKPDTKPVQPVARANDSVVAKLLVQLDRPVHLRRR